MSFKGNYGCTLSPALRLVMSTIPGVRERLQSIAEQMLATVLADETARESLQISFGGKVSPARQCDARGDNGELLYKTWTRWDQQGQRWWVYMEGPEETHWEQHFGLLQGEQ